MPRFLAKGFCCFRPAPIYTAIQAPCCWFGHKCVWPRAQVPSDSVGGLVRAAVECASYQGRAEFAGVCCPMPW